MFSSIKYLMPSIIVSLIAGCGGLDLRKGTVPSGKAGYQLYYPKILVTVSTVRQCTKPGEGGTCPDGDWEYTCLISKPWVLPDYDKPYVAKFGSGFGSQSASITVVDGWMLGEASSETDVSAFNTALLEMSIARAGDGCDPGIYEWTDKGFKFVDPPKKKT